MRKFTIHVPIYDVYVDVIIGDKSLDQHTAGLVQVYANGAFKMRLADAKLNDLHNTVGHEIFHLVFHIMKRAGLQLSLETEEAFAHLTGFLHEEFYKKLKKK